MTGASPGKSSRFPAPEVLGSAAMACLLCSAPACAQTLGQGGDDGISSWRVALVTLLCLALAVFAAFALKARLGGGWLPAFFAVARPDRRMRLVETLRLSHQIDLCIVACDGREILVAASARGATLLQTLPGAATAEEWV